MLGFLGTLEMIPMLVGDFVLGFLLGIGGVVLLIESFWEGETFDIGAIRKYPSDLFALILSLFALLYSVGLMGEISSITEVLSNLQAGIILATLVYLGYEGVKNRV